MKHFFALIMCSVFVCNISCTKNNSDSSEQLPPATQTGANTFGCLINGQVFTNGGSPLSGTNLNCYYQYIYQSHFGGPYTGYVFHLNGADYRIGCNTTSIGINFDSVKMQQGLVYTLKTLKASQGEGEYLHIVCGGVDDQFNTSDTTTMGQFMLTRFDTVNQIASGTFGFNVIDSNSDTIKITDGRFDVRLTN